MPKENLAVMTPFINAVTLIHVAPENVVVILKAWYQNIY